MAKAPEARTVSSARIYSPSAGIVIAGALFAGPISTTSVAAYTKTIQMQRQDLSTSALQAEVRALKERVAKLEQVIETVDELDWDTALSCAREYFTVSPKADVYPTELADYLGTSISQAADLCDVLAAEGVVVTA